MCSHPATRTMNQAMDVVVHVLVGVIAVAPIIAIAFVVAIVGHIVSQKLNLKKNMAILANRNIISFDLPKLSYVQTHFTTHLD